jgi:hypothetical protein
MPRYVNIKIKKNQNNFGVWGLARNVETPKRRKVEIKRAVLGVGVWGLRLRDVREAL